MSEDREPPPTLEIEGATHAYSSVIVLHDVDFDVRPGEVHGLLGENGSGKSTLIKILTGAIRPTAGLMRVDGERVKFNAPADAQRHRIAVVHQDYQLFEHMTVAENVYGVARHLPRRRWTGTLDRGEIERRATRILHDLGIDLAAGTRVGTLDPAERKFVEIARAMTLEPRYLILDEPTASLEPTAARRVLDLMRTLRGLGVGVVFVSHRLDEVMRIVDRASVLRDGRLVSRLEREDLSEEVLVELIMGAEGESDRAPAGVAVAAPLVAEDSAPVLRVADLRLRPTARPATFAVRRGEIFGLAGLLGAGPAEALRFVTGADADDRQATGRIEVDGRPARIGDPSDGVRAGIGFIPEDRKALGLVMDLSVATNISLASIGDVARYGFLRRRAMVARADGLRRRLDIRTASVAAPVRTLSGGNQQKVLIARWIASGARILAIEEPTHGVDVRGKAQIHVLLREFAADGGAVLVASTDVHELVELCDRIAVFRHDSMTRVLDSEELTGRSVVLSGIRDPEELLGHLIVGDVEAA